MRTGPSSTQRLTRVRGTEIDATDTPRQYREKLARIALDEMYQFVAVLDARGTLLEVNRAALEGGGLKLPDVEGKPFWECFWWGVSTQTQDTLQAAIQRAAQGEFIRYDVEVYGRAGGKETIVIDFSMIPVKDETGNVVFIVPEGRDITEKKAYEQEIARKNADLQALLERIRELDEIKTQFFANVSHELRTPLALIIGPAERLLNPDSAAGPDAQREAAQVIVRNARMLLKHVNDLLDISKLDAGKLKIELQNTDVAALIRFIASHFDVLAAERRIDFRVDTGASSICAVDPHKLQRVVMNLLSNAFKFVPTGGVIHCRLDAQRNDLVLTVEDSGPGVKPELRQAIFERFRQGDGGANRHFSGTGLGLAIAHEFVEMHKGTITVLESKLGGARFQVTLPAHRLPASGAGNLAFAKQPVDQSTLDGLIEELRMPASAPPAYETGQRDRASKATVLVVEDNIDMNRFVSQSLSAEYNVVSAFDGQEGLEMALASSPTLIVSDIMMPRMSGVQMIAELRLDARSRETPILLLSAKADEELKIRLLEEGAQDFITKPFTERDLRVRVRNLISLRQTQDALQETERIKRQSIEAVNLKLQERTQQLNEYFQKAPSFMAVLRGPQHTFELANASYENLVGRRSIVGKALLEALPEVDGQGFIELLDGVLRTGEPFVGSAMPVFLRSAEDGQLEQHFVDFVYQPLVGADGRFDGVFVEGHDVTDRKRAEDALRTADRRKDDFLATLAHELRNPLAPIRHAAKISKTPHATEAQVKWSHDVIDRQVEHMSRLLDDLLEVSRITRGKLELRKERLSLIDNLVATMETVRPMIEARGHKITIDAPPVLIHIDADPVRFAQIFSNLLTNAAKYTNTGGILKVQVRLLARSVQVAVQDNGIGIAPELLASVFEMFSQAASVLDRSEGGLGIGLSLVRGLVVLHGGSIEARSAGLGNGSEFIVTLPLAPADSQLAPAPAASLRAAADDQASLRILVADDNRDNADSCAMLLQMSGHDVRTAYSGRDALAIAAEFGPQVALLDIGMPELNGYQVARQLRGRDGDVMLVAVTGWGQMEDKRQAQVAGFDHHVAKPVEFESLKHLLSGFARRS
jgi:PAS domain S-box-containing protein